MAKATNYTSEYKREIIKFVTEQGRSRSDVAESMDNTFSLSYVKK